VDGQESGDGLEGEDKRKDELDSDELGRDAIAKLEAGAQELDLPDIRAGDAGTAFEALGVPGAASKLSLEDNGIGPVGAPSLAAALDKKTTLNNPGFSRQQHRR
jgi:hypothetical protein